MGRGKWQSLLATVEGHHEALEADLLKQGIDLLDLWRGRLSWRRVAVLVKYLPRDAALWTSMRIEAAREEAAERAAKGEPEPEQQIVIENQIEAMRYGDLEHLVLSFINRFDGYLYSRIDPKDRPAEGFRPTLPPGMRRAGDPTAEMLDMNSDLGRAYEASLIHTDGEGA